MKKVCIFVHGILARDRGAKFERLAPYFDDLGYRTETFAWGFGFLLRTLFLTWVQVRRVTKLAEWLATDGYQVVGVGHSHGANILARASQRGAPFTVLAFLNGALDRDARIGPAVHYVLNYHAPGDPVLPLTALWPVPQWGTLGKRGWKVSAMDRDTRLWQVDMREAFGVGGHSDAFAPAKMELVGLHLANAVEQFRAFAAGEITEI